ncbi:MAG: pyruvate kinase [Eubacteriales bacterium]|nr:pyruvate kinase [Eubacteriales bacterium]
MRKTKIICTLGPATDKDDILEQLVIEGMDVARFNFSHNSCEEQKVRMDKVKALRKKHKKPIACLLDTKGPEIRIKTFKNGSIQLKQGQKFCLTTRDVVGDESIVSVTYPDFIKDISVGSSILIDDGLIELKVLSIEGQDALCQAVNGGKISNRKGVNLPGVKISMPYLSDKDRQDILFGIREDIDFIAASFTRNAGDVRQIRQLLKKNGGEDIKIIAKVENAEGIENIDEIIEASDGVMVARGDMGVEIPEEDVPILQKMIIQKVCSAGKIVITATQMLDSMMKNPRPTRAETTDVANAIYDGTSAIMLSGETAAGAYPVEALKTMSKIALRTEQAINYQKRFNNLTLNEQPGVTDAICHATCSTAYDLNAKAILTVTKSGFSARMISRFRPACDIIGCAIEEKVCRQLNLSWGVRPILLKEEWEVFVLFERAITAGKNQGYLKEGDLTVITSGVPIGRSGTTNMLKVQVVE